MAKTELMVAGFSYAGMDKDAEAKLRYCAKELQKLKSELAGKALAIGETIAIAHEQLANQRNGEFLKWVEFEGGFSRTSAYNYMAAFKLFGNVPTVGSIEDSAMYALAQNGTPEKAVKEVLRLADKGVKITQKQAKAIIKKHKSATTAGAAPGQVASGSPAATTAPPPPPPTKEEQLKLELKKARSYAEGLIRALDDVNRIKRNTVVHPQLLELCGQILKGLERW